MTEGKIGNLKIYRTPILPFQPPNPPCVRFGAVQAPARTKTYPKNPNPPPKPVPPLSLPLDQALTNSSTKCKVSEPTVKTEKKSTEYLDK